MKHEARLIWCDALEVVKDLFSNPMFANYMSYDPHKVTVGQEREYSKFFTGMRAFAIQVSHLQLCIRIYFANILSITSQAQLPVGSTIILIILASDKTPVTRQTGGLEMHPLFLTIGNIQSDIRMQATSHAWRCVAFIPSPEFEVPQDLRTLLLARIFHWSLDIVTALLKVAAKEGGPMVDPMGKIRNCYTPLVSYIADLPEQQLIACVSRNASPVTLAELPQFGDPTPAAPRTCEHTLSLILELCKKTDPWDIDHFQKAAKALKLLGIHLPFFRNWKFSDPSLFLTGEVLHTGHKFFFDHILSWCKTLAGPHILNTRFSNLHHRVSFCHFSSGVSRPLQMTGRDHRDIERTIVPILADVGNVTDEFIYAIRAIVEFIYRAQDPVHTDSSINAMEQALADFHARKQVIINLKAQKGKNTVINHFNIPKLKLMNSFGRQTRANGPLIQYTADVSERLLIMHCKTTFQRTSRVEAIPIYVEELLLQLTCWVECTT